MNKSELIDKISIDAGITKSQAKIVLTSLTDSVIATLKGGGKVTLAGFGTFSINKRPARSARNPQTGQTIKIKAKKIPKFSSGQALKKRIQEPGTDDTGPMKTKKRKS